MLWKISGGKELGHLLSQLHCFSLQWQCPLPHQMWRTSISEKKNPPKNPTPRNPKKFATVGSLSSFHLLSVAFCQWFHFGNFSLLNQFLYVLLLLLLFFIYLFLKSFHISVSSLPPDGLFTRLGTYILQQDFQSCVRTSEEEDCFIPMIIINNGSPFTSSI